MERILTCCGWRRDAGLLLLTVGLGGGVASAAPGQSNPPPAAVAAVRAYRAAHESEILAEFSALLVVPNVAADTSGIRRNADLLLAMLRHRGLDPRLLEAGSAGGAPAVYGEWPVSSVRRTLLLYAHYDGQPTDPAKWRSGAPWTPVLRTAPFERGGVVRALPTPGEHTDSSWRLYARSASDDKGGVMAILVGLDALRSAGITPTSNVKLFFEGEEEAGSPHLSAILSRAAPVLAADAWIIVDGPVHQSGAKQVVFGVRGDMQVDVTVFGPKRPLHSGHYGNWAPNPAERLARLLASMKDSTGRVTIAGWYDDVVPLSDADRRAIAAAPRYDAELQRDLGIARPEQAGQPLAELLALPSLNINGLESAEVGAGARNIIPTSATAALDLRLVPGNDHERQFQRLVEHVRRQGYLVLDRPPTDAERQSSPLIAMVVPRPGAYNAARTPLDLPLAQSVVAAVRSTTDRAVILVPAFGGSAPLSLIREQLGAPSLIVPLANYDNNQHAEDENIRLANLWSGVESIAAILAMP